MSQPVFPITRLRRLRQTPALRALFAETTLSVDDFIYPLFVVHGANVREPIPSMPDCFRLSVDQLLVEAQECVDLGVKALMLFGIPEEKDTAGSENYASDGIIQQALTALREKYPQLTLFTDVCLCEYTDHGHCGHLAKDAHGEPAVENDSTLATLGKVAVSHARAGAHVVAPSAMMDGQVAAIRGALDDAGFAMTPIMGYSAKFASAFYGPFRDAAGSAPPPGEDRRTYQMNPSNGAEAMREIATDIDEGADVIMVKPALAYLDIIREAKNQYPDMPLTAYNVSGEYSLIKAGAQLGWLDETATMMESLIAIKRAGADVILTYWAKRAAAVLMKTD